MKKLVLKSVLVLGVILSVASCKKDHKKEGHADHKKERKHKSEYEKTKEVNGIEITESPVTPEGLAALLTLIAKGTISGKIAKQVFPEMWETGKAAEEIVKEKGLIQISDT